MNPRRRNRAIVAAGLVIALVGAAASPVLADRKDDLKDRRHQVTRTLKGADRDLDESSARLIATHRALFRAQSKLAAAREHLAETRGQLLAARALDDLMRERLSEAEDRLSIAEGALSQGQQAVTGAEDDLAQFVVQSMEFGDPNLVGLGLVLQGDDPGDLGEQMGITDSVTGAQAGNVDRLDAAKTLLTIMEQHVQDMRDDVAVNREEAARNLDRRRVLETAARQQTAEVRGLVVEAATAQRRAERAKRSDLRKIRQLEADRARIGQMLKKLAETKRLQALRKSRSGGYLSWPVDSYITSPYGMRLHPILLVYKLHDGTDFGAGCGTPVRAAASGTIVSEYYNTGYGNRLIMSNGTAKGVALATSYNHLSGYAASAGERVERGEVIAYAGTTGYSTGCHLHFMVYENGATVDPMKWLSH